MSPFTCFLKTQEKDTFKYKTTCKPRHPNLPNTHAGLNTKKKFPCSQLSDLLPPAGILPLDRSGGCLLWPHNSASGT